MFICTIKENKIKQKHATQNKDYITILQHQIANTLDDDNIIQLTISTYQFNSTNNYSPIQLKN